MNKQNRIALAFSLAISLLAGWATVAAEPPDADTADDPVTAAGTELTVVAPKDLSDIAIAANPRFTKRSLAIAANPRHPNVLVVGASRSLGPPPETCVVYRSGDGGRTWSKPIRLPLLPNSSVGYCNDLDLAYSPDGSRIYAALGAGLEDGSVVVLVSSSGDDGRTWRTPVISLKGPAGFFAWTPKITTPLREEDGNWLYLTVRYGVSDGVYYNAFIRSADRGVSWSAPQMLATGSYHGTDISRASVAGGVGGVVIATWSEGPEFMETPHVIKTRASRNHGETFAPAVTATAATHDSWSPDVKIGDKGVAHVVYVGEHFGEIDYVWSGPPYTTWSKPVRIDDDALPLHEYVPSLATQRCGTSTILHVVWQGLLSPEGCVYCYYDVFYARKVAKSGAAWSKNIRVSDKSSFLGYLQAAVSQGRVFATWTVWRDPANSNADLYGSGILSGITCP